MFVTGEGKGQRLSKVCFSSLILPTIRWPDKVWFNLTCNFDMNTLSNSEYWIEVTTLLFLRTKSFPIEIAFLCFDLMCIV